jgi:hypothetical protein
MAPRLGTSTTKSDALKAYATFRIAGDTLAPDQITRILRVPPTTAYTKGQKYYGGPRSPELVGRTGIWYLATDKMLASNNLDEHLGLLANILLDDDFKPFLQLKDILKRKGWTAHASCFWYGRAGAKKPVIPEVVPEMLKVLPADLELDFDTDEDTGRRKAG